MNRKTRRDNKRELRKNSLDLFHELRELPPEMWYEQVSKIPEYLEKVYLSRSFLVQVYVEPDKPDRLSICRNGVDKDGNWLEHITWEELQHIKNSVGYSDYDCIELFPKECDVVNVANMRHLWAVGQIDFVWRS